MPGGLIPLSIAGSLEELRPGRNRLVHRLESAPVCLNISRLNLRTRFAVFRRLQSLHRLRRMPDRQEEQNRRAYGGCGESQRAGEANHVQQGWVNIGLIVEQFFHVPSHGGEGQQDVRGERPPGPGAHRKTRDRI